jgi:hypothetical protein
VTQGSFPSLHSHVHIGFEHQSLAQLMLGVYPWSANGLNVKFTTHTHILFRLSMCAAVSKFPSYALNIYCLGRYLLHACFVRAGASSVVI